jgi:hypothetical protein
MVSKPTVVGDPCLFRDVAETEDGLVLSLRRSKTDQQGQRNKVVGSESEATESEATCQTVRKELN